MFYNSFLFSRGVQTVHDTNPRIAQIIRIEFASFARIRILASRHIRSEPSSRTILIGEQPNPWDLLQPRDMVSRHRGAELRRRYGRLGGTSLLSPE